MGERAPLEKQAVETPLFELVRLESHVLLGLQECLYAIGMGVNQEGALGGEAPLESAWGAPLEEEGYCRQGAGTGSLLGLLYKCDYPARVFSLVAVVECDACPG